MTHLATEHPDEARRAFARAEQVIGAKLREKPEAANLVVAHAVALAGVGRGEEALTVFPRCFGLYPVSKDSWIRTWRLHDLAYVQMLADRPAAAVRTLAELVTKPTDIISPQILAATPHFDRLRGREDFQRLLADSI